ncbi:DUF3040 domain-containing protein [Amycolatopsis thermophila]|uniref:DUF3040 domain-containing protein n=1 Tax=Amycolatopsis thermophila TaxID=206084 RepID=A0ABU0F1W4_9PSEU|nr:DUF3040 domain-containing protein [Amycolatopsis thermophila]MDQ0381383.1 hypothetical protein [Amycolatopsis thermophila]
MTLSSQQRRALAAIEWDLSAEPGLATLAGLFAESPRGPSSWPEPRTGTAPARRSRFVRWPAGTAAALGLADAVVAGLAGLTTLVSIGVVVVISAVAVIVADLLCPDRSAAPPMPDPFSRG